MAGSAGTENYNAAGNSDFSRKVMEQAEAMLAWASPRTITGGAESAERKKELGRNNSGGGCLQAQASEWMAPNVPNGGRTAHHAELTGRTAMHKGKKVQIGLEHQAGSWNPPANQGPAWPGLAARDHKGSSEGSTTRQDGKSRADMLDYAAEQFFSPPSSPARPIAAGSMSSIAGPNSNQPSVRRKLNPIFVEALMRWPTGLSGFARPATGSILSLRHGLGSASNGGLPNERSPFDDWWMTQSAFLSALCSPAVAAQLDMFGQAA